MKNAKKDKELQTIKKGLIQALYTVHKQLLRVKKKLAGGTDPSPAEVGLPIKAAAVLYQLLKWKAEEYELDRKTARQFQTLTTEQLTRMSQEVQRFALPNVELPEPPAHEMALIHGPPEARNGSDTLQTESN